jgi:hypothetical protein
VLHRPSYAGEPRGIDWFDWFVWFDWFHGSGLTLGIALAAQSTHSRVCMLGTTWQVRMLLNEWSSLAA